MRSATPGFEMEPLRGFHRSYSTRVLTMRWNDEQNRTDHHLVAGHRDEHRALDVGHAFGEVDVGNRMALRNAGYEFRLIRQ